MKPTRVTSSDESGKRQAIIDASRRMNALGIDQGTSPAQQYPGRLQICKPLLLRSLGMPLQAVPLAPGSSVGGMPYGLAIALATMAMVALAHR